MHNPIGEHYRSTFAKLLPQLPQLRTMFNKEDAAATEICFRALYAAMLYRIKGDTKRADAIKDTIELVSPVVAHLAAMYGKVERGEVDLLRICSYLPRKHPPKPTRRGKNGRRRVFYLKIVCVFKKNVLPLPSAKIMLRHNLSKT